VEGKKSHLIELLAIHLASPEELLCLFMGKKAEAPVVLRPIFPTSRGDFEGNAEKSQPLFWWENHLFHRVLRSKVKSSEKLKN